MGFTIQGYGIALISPKPEIVVGELKSGVGLARMPSSTLIPFLAGLGSLINPFKQKRAPCLSLGYWV